MSDFKAEVHQIHFLLGLHPRPAGELIVLCQTLVVFKGPISKGGRRREGRGRKAEGERSVGKGFGPHKNLAWRPLYSKDPAKP